MSPEFTYPVSLDCDVRMTWSFPRTGQRNFSRRGFLFHWRSRWVEAVFSFQFSVFSFQFSVGRGRSSWSGLYSYGKEREGRLESCSRETLGGEGSCSAEFDDALLGPEALASGVFRNEAAMAAVLGRDKLDGGILADFGG